MKKVLSIFFSFIMASLPLNSFASPLELEKKLKEKFPKLVLPEPPKEIRPGLYLFFVDGQIAFSDKDLNFMLTGGSLLDTEKVEDITAKLYTDRYKTAFQSLPFDKAITTVLGKGGQEIAIFIDPDCVFCQAFEKMLVAEKNNLDLVVHRFFLPLKIHPNAMSLSKRILCSSNPEKALLDYMIEKSETSMSQSESCPEAMNAEISNAIARSYQFRGTPTILFETNTILQGNVNLTNLKTALEDIRKSKNN